jgi:hypothetical protein
MTSCSKRAREGGAPSTQCLIRAARDVAHDLTLLTEAWAMRASRLGYTQWFLLARSIDDFFFTFQRKRLDPKKLKFADDILAADFLPAGEWEPIANALKDAAPDDRADIRRAANKLAAHLTYSRADIRTEKGIAPSEPFHRFLGGVASVWLRRMPDERRVWFG